MATRTVSAAGGTFTTGATWVGGVAPVAGDDIVANATSGNLTIGANTVSLIGANFTGYTGTLALGAFNLIIGNTGGSLIFSPTMTITAAGGFIRVGSNGTSTTLTSNGLIDIPINFFNANATVTLTDTLTTSRISSTIGVIITGSNDIVFTGTTQPTSMVGLTMRNPCKFIFRPSGTLTMSGNLGQGITSFDSTQTISISGVSIPIKGSSGVTTHTIEFARGTTWSGIGSINNRPNFSYDSSNILGVGSTLSFITTAPQYVANLDVFGPSGNMAVSFTNKFLSDSIYLRSNTSESAGRVAVGGTISVVGSGGFSASNVTITPTRVLISSGFYSGKPTVRLSSDATYSVTNLIIQGNLAQGSSSFPAELSSITASVPATIDISNGAYAWTNIIDINNVGRTQYALTNSGNTLTRTTGFVPNAGGSFTFVN